MGISFFDASSLTSAWALGMFTLSITNDNDAIILCRMNLLELESAIEELQKKLSSSNNNDHSEKIRSIISIIKRLNVNQAGLFVKNIELQSLIKQSLDLMRRFEYNSYAAENKPCFIGVDLVELWGAKQDRSLGVSKISCLQMFFHAGFFKRMWLRVCDVIMKSKWIREDNQERS